MNNNFEEIKRKAEKVKLAKIMVILRFRSTVRVMISLIVFTLVRKQLPPARVQIVLISLD